jgi:hypothetical protein
MAQLKLNFRRFANEKTASCSLFIAFTRLKTQCKNSHKLFTCRLANEFLKFKMVKKIYFWKHNWRKSEDKNTNKIEKY